MKITLAPEAVDDLAAAIEYLSERNPRAAVVTADAVFQTIDRLAARDFEGPERELRTTLSASEVGQCARTGSITGGTTTGLSS